MERIGVRWEVAGEAQLDRFFADVVLLSRDFKPALTGIGDDWYATERAVFAAEGAAEGNPAWAKLSPVYAWWKQSKYPGRGILERTGRMMRSLTEHGAPDSVYELTNDSLTLGSTLRVGRGGQWNLAMLHQTGTRKMPARKPGLLTQAQRIRWTKIVQRELNAIFSQAQGAGGVVGGGRLRA